MNYNKLKKQKITNKFIIDTQAHFLHPITMTTDCKSTISLTEKAAKEILSLAKEDSEEGQCLRFGVEQGGCSGHEYAMGFDFPQKDDITIESHGVKIIVDPHSLELLKGIVVDFEDGIDGKGFSFDNPNASRTCGCGKSFNN